MPKTNVQPTKPNRPDDFDKGWTDFKIPAFWKGSFTVYLSCGHTHFTYRAPKKDETFPCGTCAHNALTRSEPTADESTVESSSEDAEKKTVKAVKTIRRKSK